MSIRIGYVYLRDLLRALLAGIPQKPAADTAKTVCQNCPVSRYVAVENGLLVIIMKSQKGKLTGRVEVKSFHIFQLVSWKWRLFSIIVGKGYWEFVGVMISSELVNVFKKYRRFFFSAK